MTVVDRTDPAWLRLRRNCCETAGQSDALDIQADRVFAVTHPRRAVEQLVANPQVVSAGSSGAISPRPPGL